MIRACWHVSENFGDNLTPYLIKKISGHVAVFTEQSQSSVTYLVTGSLLGSRIGNSIIWGTGTVWKDDRLYTVIRPTANHKVIATRGPISQQMIVDKGGPKSLLYGDPGLILPKVYNPQIVKKHEIGFVPSCIDYHIAKEKFKEYKVIDVMAPVEKVINEILECKTIFASALHGLITAVAYNIPAYWCKFSDNIVGDGTKYHDFLLSIGCEIYQPVDFRIQKLNDVINYPFLHNIGIDLSNLFESCPFRFKS